MAVTDSARAVSVSFDVEVPYCTPTDVPVMLRSDRLTAGAFQHDALTRIDATHYRGTFEVAIDFAQFSYKYSSGTCDPNACPGTEKALEYAGTGLDIPDRTLAPGTTAVHDLVFVWRNAVILTDASGTSMGVRSGDQKVAFCAPYLSISSVDGSVTISFDSYSGSDVRLELGTTTNYGRTERSTGHNRNHFPLNDLAPGTHYHYRLTEVGRPPFLGEFTTPAAPDAAFRFAFIGDTQYYEELQRTDVRAIVDRINAFNPSLVISPGDMVASVQGTGPHGWVLPETGRFNVFFGLVAPLMARAPFMVSMGNHEEDVDYFWSAFEFPKPDAPNLDHYFYQDGNVAFIHLYTGVTEGYDLNGILDSQTQWMEAVLRGLAADPSVRWKVIVLHRGAFSQGANHPSDGYDFYAGGTPTRTAWGVLWHDFGVDLVLAGHNHNFTVAEHDGIRYLTSCGGAPTHPLQANTLPSTLYAEEICTADLFEVGARTIQVHAERGDGTTIPESVFALCHADQDCLEVPTACPEARRPRCQRPTCQDVCEPFLPLSATPNALHFQVRLGDALPGAQALWVQAGTDQHAPFSIRCPEPWLRCGAAGTTTPSTVSVSLDGLSAMGLQPGTYAGTVLIDRSGTTTVGVSLDVLPLRTSTTPPENHAPTAPVPVSPLGDVAVAPGMIQLIYLSSTDPDGDALRYRLSWSVGSAQQTEAIESGTSHAVQVGPEHVVRWQVRAEDARGGVSDASAWAEFRTNRADESPTPTPSPVASPGGCGCQGTTPLGPGAWWTAGVLWLWRRRRSVNEASPAGREGDPGSP